ncbi:hypothetical protein GCM10020295_14120 [Streptomyces cinereospinus]
MRRSAPVLSVALMAGTVPAGSAEPATEVAPAAARPGGPPIAGAPGAAGPRPRRGDTPGDA